MTAQCRLDWVTTNVRDSVEPAYLGTDSVFHYSIPMIEETGDGCEESVSSIASAKLLLQGDEVLISRLNPRKSRVLASSMHDVPTVCSGEFVVLRPTHRIDKDFLVWRLSSADVTQELDSHVRSVTRSHQRVDPQRITKMWIDLPEVAQQRTIARFLDRECAEIDALLAEIEGQGALIRERYKASLISTFSPMSPAWSWTDTRLKFIFDYERNGIWGEDPAGDENDVVCVRVADFDRFTFRAGREAETIRNVPANQAQTRLLRPGDVLLEKSGGTHDKPVGCAVSFDGEQTAVCSNFIAQLRPSEGIHPRFAGLLLASFYESRRNAPFVKQTTGIQNLDSSQYLGLHVAIPPLREQVAMANDFDQELEAIQRALSEFETSMSLALERRQALITAAVTGQMEVT